MFIIYMMISIDMFLNSAPHGIIFLLIEEMKHTPIKLKMLHFNIWYPAKRL